MSVDAEPKSGSHDPRSASHAVGSRLRRLRNLKGLSLRALASEIGVTASLLSQVENGQVNPSLDTLLRLAAGLATPVSYFFPNDESHQETEQGPEPPERTASPVVRSAHRERLEFIDGVIWENLLPHPEPDLEWVVITYPPRAPEPPPLLRHGGNDYGLVISGEVTVALGFEEYRLSPGDSIAFDATTPHRVFNNTPASASAVWLIRNRHRSQ